MTLGDIPTWLPVGGGGLGIMSYLIIRLVNIAVNAERGRATDWRTAYEREVARGDVRDAQMSEILKAIRGEKS